MIVNHIFICNLQSEKKNTPTKLATSSSHAIATDSRTEGQNTVCLGASSLDMGNVLPFWMRGMLPLDQHKNQHFPSQYTGTTLLLHFTDTVP